MPVAFEPFAWRSRLAPERPVGYDLRERIIYPRFAHYNPAQMYRWLEHTGEVQLEVEADSEVNVFAEALEGLAELLDSRHDQTAAEVTVVNVIATAVDRPALLIEWINSLLYCAETERVIPVGVKRIDLSSDRVEAEVLARRSVPSSLVKAATYHDLCFEQRGATWYAKVVLDV